MRFAGSPMERATLFILVMDLLIVLWLGPEIRQAAAAARADDSPAWAVLLLIFSLGLFAYGALEVYLIHVTREPPPPDL